MECIIPGSNMKGKALQALSKVGDELFMEAKRESLTFITLNASKTVCARFEFNENFFSSFEVNAEDLKRSSVITCKVHMKIFLPLFKSNVEKKLDYFKLEYIADSDFMIFKMKYKIDEIMMVHRLRLMDSETLSIGVEKNSGMNGLQAPSSFYSQMLAMFSTNDDEVTFEIKDKTVIARNYCVGAPCRPKKMRTHINLNASEFTSYKITKDTSINLSLKPLRTAVNFAENFELHIELNFEIGGKPLTIIVQNPTFEVNFIVATLDPYSDASSTVATTTKSTNGVSSEEFVAMENWDRDLSKESSFVEAIKDDVIPESPESPRTKRAKLVFGRCYEMTFCENVLGGVLAPNSDSE